MVDYTSNEYHETRHAEFLGDLELQGAWSSFAYHEYFERILHAMGRQRVFEFGGAFGYNMLRLVQKHECHLLELSELGRKVASMAGIVTYAHESNVPEDFFDVVLCRHVLEHVDSPVETLKFMKSRLLKGGKLILVLPLDGVKQEPLSDDIDHHLFCWNARTATNLVARAGLRLDSWRYSFYNGRRLMLPVHKYLGGRSYAATIGFLGRIRNSRELVIEATNS